MLIAVQDYDAFTDALGDRAISRFYRSLRKIRQTLVDISGPY